MESFGARLKREREKRKITLDDISISTKIGTRFLVALEEDNFDQLPGGIFNKGFVRAYARHLGLDEAQTIADFEAASEPVLPEPEPTDATELAAMAVRVPETAKRPEGGLPWGAFAAALLVIAIGFAFWGFHSREKPKRLPVRGTPDQMTGQVAQPAAAESSSPAAQEAAPPQETTASTTQAAPPETEAKVSETAAAAAPAPNAGTFQVLVNAREDAWVAITADGKQVVATTLAASAGKSVEARSQVVIKTGNAGALDISFNGKKLAPQGAYNQVRTITLGPNGLQP